MTFLDLCAGIGGFSLGLEMAGLICKGQVEIDEFCNKILEKHWPDVPRWGDIKKISPNDLPTTDLVCGGYPCQPFSVAGRMQGENDERHLWPEIFAIVKSTRPTWCLFENVTGHIRLGLDKVLADLESQNYACQTLVIPACAVDAPHIRSRVWILAYADGGEPRQPTKQEGRENISRRSEKNSRQWWPAEPPVGRLADGISGRVARLKALGNAVVPQIVYQIGLAIMEANGKTFDS